MNLTIAYIIKGIVALIPVIIMVVVIKKAMADKTASEEKANKAIKTIKQNPLTTILWGFSAIGLVAILGMSLGSFTDNLIKNAKHNEQPKNEVSPNEPKKNLSLNDVGKEIEKSFGF